MLYIPQSHLLPDKKDDIFKGIRVRINGLPCPVRTCRVSALPFNRHWPGHQRPVDQTEKAPYLRFFADESVNVEVEYENGIQGKPVIRPQIKGIRTKTEGNTVKFTLPTCGDYVLEAGGYHTAVHLFYSPLKEEARPEEVTHYFGPGVHYPVILNLHSHDRVYLHPEATVFATVFAKDAEDVRIFGGGVLNASCIERPLEGCYDGIPLSNIRMTGCQSIRIEDVILLDSACWVLALFDCDDIVIDGVKILGQWRYNTDGIDLTNTSNAVIRNCFIRSFDDTVVIKQINNHGVTENITVEDCVCWCDWGKNLEIGLETAGDEIRNLRFTRCHLIRNDDGAMAISNGHYANIHHIVYEDISVEYPADALPHQLQTEEHPVYEMTSTPHTPRLLRIHNRKFSHTYKVDVAGERDKEPGKVHHVSYRNIRLFLEEGVPFPPIYINSEYDSAIFDHITVDGVYVNGERIPSAHAFPLTLTNAKPLEWK